MSALVIKRGALLTISQDQRHTTLFYGDAHAQYIVVQTCAYIDGSGKGWRQLYSSYNDALNAFNHATK